MRVNRGSSGGPAEETDGSGMSAPPGRSGGTQGSGSSGGMRAPAGGAQREGGDRLEGRTDRGNQNDEGIGSSASRGGGSGEANTPRSDAPADLDPMLDTADRFGTSGRSSGNPDVTGTTDEAED